MKGCKTSIFISFFRYYLIGTYVNKILRIESQTNGSAVIKTNRDNAFDFEKQTSLNVPIQAKDKANHIVSAELEITVIDVNDEPPVLKVVSINYDIFWRCT